MRNRNPDGPWNPDEPVEVSPKEFERQVLRRLLAERYGEASLGPGFSIIALTGCTILDIPPAPQDETSATGCRSPQTASSRL